MRPEAGGIRDLIARLGVRPATRHAERCANCGIPIDADRGGTDGASSVTPRVVRGDDVYCCDGCADGGPCIC